jgi:hypothetical protein
MISARTVIPVNFIIDGIVNNTIEIPIDIMAIPVPFNCGWEYCVV